LGDGIGLVTADAAAAENDVIELHRSGIPSIVSGWRGYSWFSEACAIYEVRPLRVGL
jgi:hypothetical protein